MNDPDGGLAATRRRGRHAFVLNLICGVALLISVWFWLYEMGFHWNDPVWLTPTFLTTAGLIAAIGFNAARMARGRAGWRWVLALQVVAWLAVLFLFGVGFLYMVVFSQ